MNGEHFAVMAGAGLDARMIADAGWGMKERLGRSAYLFTGASNLFAPGAQAAVEVDGRRFYEGARSPACSRATSARSWAGWSSSRRQIGDQRQRSSVTAGAQTTNTSEAYVPTAVSAWPGWPLAASEAYHGA